MGMGCGRWKIRSVKRGLFGSVFRVDEIDRHYPGFFRIDALEGVDLTVERVSVAADPYVKEFIDYVNNKLWNLTSISETGTPLILEARSACARNLRRVSDRFLTLNQFDLDTAIAAAQTWGEYDAKRLIVAGKSMKVDNVQLQEIEGLAHSLRFNAAAGRLDSDQQRVLSDMTRATNSCCRHLRPRKVAVADDHVRADISVNKSHITNISKIRARKRAEYINKLVEITNFVLQKVRLSLLVYN